MRSLVSNLPFRLGFLLSLICLIPSRATADSADRPDGRLLYVAVPGIRNYLEFGGHGVLVFDIDHGHRFVRRIAAAGLGKGGAPLNVKGICASATTGRLYVSTLETLTCFDLLSDRILWEKPYQDGCDRMSITADGRSLYVPSLEKSSWNLVDGLTGEVRTTFPGHVAAHNTVISLDGRKVFLGDRHDRMLAVVDTSKEREIVKLGPFGDAVRPLTVDGSGRRIYVCVDELLGFEIGDIETGRVLHRVEVTGFKKGPIKRHGCPSHGIGLTPDEREIWLADAANERLHVFDNTVSPPKQVTSLKVREQPGWITFSIAGDYAYSSTGDVFDARTHAPVTGLACESNAPVHSEKMVEIDFRGGRPVTVGDQFGVGRVLR